MKKDVLPQSRRLASFLVLMVLGGCGIRPDADTLVAREVAIPSNAVVQTVLVASNRHASASDQLAARPRHLEFENFDIAVPKTRRLGDVDYPSATVDPNKHKVVIKRERQTRKEFLSAVRTEPASSNFGIFVHGFNTTYQEGVFRVAQMAADAGTTKRSVLFSWPSRGELTGYVADKEAATYSRDALVDLLTDVSRARNGGETIVMAHSMGSWLVVESLRQLRLRGRDDVLSKLRVMLAAPDIDPKVFTSQMDAIGKLPKPMTVFVSKGDNALWLSTILSGERHRVGSLDAEDTEVAEVARKNGVLIVDISSIEASDDIGHDRYAKLAGLLSQQGDASDAQPFELHSPGAFVLNLAEAGASAPFRLVDTFSGKR